MKQHKCFSTSIKLWFHTFLDMITGVVIGFVLLLIAMNVLNTETVKYYDIYVKIGIILLGYIGLFVGTHKMFSKFFKEKMYFPRRIKYFVALYQTIIFAIFGYFCYMNKINVILFIGGYASIFIQFMFIYLYSSINNLKYPKDTINTTSIKDTPDKNKHAQNKTETKIFNFDIESLK